MRSILITSVVTALMASVAITVRAGQPVMPVMTEIPAGTFVMGSDRGNTDSDESPRHRVTISRPFMMSVTEVTNAQYEHFFPEHRALRGIDFGVSAGDDDPVVNVSYDDAMAYCRRLSESTGQTFRLPTEAEWEYACRANTVSDYWTGDTLPDIFCKAQHIARDYAPVDLTVALTPANPFGLFDMHGNVEEWCLDWYGPYSRDDARDPAGPHSGIYRVTRGGSHNTPVEFLRSSNRMAMLPSDRHSLTGFRIVQPSGSDELVYDQAVTTAAQPRVEQSRYRWPAPASDPVFLEPIPFVIASDSASEIPFYSHNHQPAVTWCDNGDLLAIWFSANAENGREMVVLQSRLRPDADSWDKASLFFVIPDRNLTGSSLLNDGRGTLRHINGMEAAGDWQNLAMVMRISRDNGSTWTDPRIIAPRHTRRHQVIAGPIITSDGRLIQLCDAGPAGDDGTAIHISADDGSTWADPWDGAPLPEFAEGGSGTTIAGIHAGIVELGDGRLMALGRGCGIADSEGVLRMPMSISADGGRTWTYSASPFAPIGSGQRLVLRRLAEGPLLLISFGLQGMFAALSYDEGESWPVRKLITDGVERTLEGGAWTGSFTLDASHAEPKGYLAATQTPDGMIHLLSSRMHYRFNLPWLEMH